MNSVHYSSRGSGRPLVLIHGFCETSAIWSSLADKLALKYHVITPDLPGFGESPLPNGSFSIDDVGVILLQWIEPWRSEAPVVIGHSLGGYVALAMAAADQGIFGGLGLFHSTAYADTAEKKESRNKVIDFVERNGVEAYTRSFVPGLFYQKELVVVEAVREMAAQTAAETLTAYARAMRDRNDRLEILKEFNRPVLFVSGEQDQVIPAGQIREQSLLAKQAAFYSIIGAGHMGMLENEPASINIVEDFMGFTDRL
jgi:pimeloyl-ACP methyl ester carboxylesterase